MLLALSILFLWLASLLMRRARHARQDHYQPFVKQLGALEERVGLVERRLQWAKEQARGQETHLAQLSQLALDLKLEGSQEQGNGAG